MKIKICGLSRECDIGFVNEAMPDYIGFILHFPKSRRNIAAERAAYLRKRLRPGIKAAGVFVDQPLETVLETTALIGLDVIQLHGREDDSYIRVLREETGLPVWKAFKVREETGPSPDLPLRFPSAGRGCGTDSTLKILSTDGGCGTDRSLKKPSADEGRGTDRHLNVPSCLVPALRSAADEILLDNGYGTGQAFDWSALEGFVRPFILAGGLTPEKIPEAAAILGVKLLDLSSGVETEGVKDRGKILASVRAAHIAGSVSCQTRPFKAVESAVHSAGSVS